MYEIAGWFSKTIPVNKEKNNKTIEISLVFLSPYATGKVLQLLATAPFMFSKSLMSSRTIMTKNKKIAWMKIILEKFLK